MTPAAARFLWVGGLILVAAGCGPAPARNPPGPPAIPRIGPTASTPPPLTLRPAALPPGARAHLPALDGDRFSVTLAPGPSLSTAALRTQIVDPILEAVGATGVTLGSPDAPRSQPVANVDALLARPRAGKTLETIERAEGRPAGSLRADLARRELHHVFAQVVDGVPVEHAGVIAAQREGDGIHAVNGALLARFTVVNRSALGSKAAAAAATREIRTLPGVGPALAAGEPAAVLLAVGRDGAGRARLHHAYRVDVTARYRRMAAPFRVWIDAESGRLLKADPLFGATAAQGHAWSPDPGSPPVARTFEVDPARSSKYTLRLADVFDRLDYRGDGYNGSDVSVSKTSSGSSGSLANFGQSSINNPAGAVCAVGGNRAFQQVHAYATLSTLREQVIAAGIDEPFPATPWQVIVERRGGNDPSTGECQSWSTMMFGACAGYYAPDCPDAVNDNAHDAQLNHAHDATILAHELGHNITLRLTSGRPGDWCGKRPKHCPVVHSPTGLEDMADFWAAHLLSTTCIGGWMGKNVGGKDHSRNCQPGHQEDWLLPRRLEITPTLDPANPADHFPEKRSTGIGCSEYCDGQIVGAALWQVRAGLERRFPSTGVATFGARVQSAMRRTGLGPGIYPPYMDTQIYQLLYDIALELTREWPGSADAHSVNKVTTGLARAGLFLVPYQCLVVSGTPPEACPPGAGGGDAVVDVDADYLAPGAAAPAFSVWTGPRYRLVVPYGAAVIQNPPPCHPAFKVEISSDPQFPAAATADSGWLTVNTQALSDGVGECRGAWTPAVADWDRVKSGASRIYYRARTRDASGGNERISTSPAQGLFDVPPPFAQITPAGRPQ